MICKCEVPYVNLFTDYEIFSTNYIHCFMHIKEMDW